MRCPCHATDFCANLEPILDMIKEFEEIKFIETSVEERVHALEGGLAEVQSVVHRVFERTHLHLANQLFPHLSVKRN